MGMTSVVQWAEYWVHWAALQLLVGYIYNEQLWCNGLSVETEVYNTGDARHCTGLGTLSTVQWAEYGD